MARADNEKDVQKILERAGYWNNPEVWKFYGGKENNFATIGNQQSSADTALVEKIINSVDAVLIRECLRRNIDPEGEDAPQTLEDATEEFFNVKRGSLANLNSRERTKLAENIILVATGKKTNPSYSIIDKGEGQTPSKMPNTFLSLTESNKMRIPFVQGKFNMGSTGSLQFCGDQNIQLIISRKDPKINVENDETSNLWGFTVIRREDPSENMKSSTFKYLAVNNEILTFEADSLPLLPGNYPEPYENPLKWGTFIKLYEYQLKSYKTLITFNLSYRLSLLLPTLALPVLLYERRPGYKGNTYNSTLAGLNVRLDEDRNENIEEGFPSSDILNVNGQEMKVQVYLFKRDSRVENYKKNEGIIFTVNGQAHGFISKTFFKRNKVGMSYLADSILVLVDCSKLDGRAREDLFMNSRDRLRSGELKSSIERELEHLIKEHPGLRELKEKRRREDIGDNLKDSKPLADVIEKVIKKSPGLYSLLVTGERINNPFNLMDTGTNDKFEGKFFPTYFQLIKEFTAEKPKHCPIDQKFRIKFETNAENNYFTRDIDNGESKISCKNGPMKNSHFKLWNGIANLNCQLPENIEVGDLIEFSVKVNDVSRLDPFSTKFYVKVDSKAEKQSGAAGKRIKPPGKNGNKRKKQSKLALPKIVEIYKNEWEKYGFKKDTALSVQDSGEDGYDFYINMDNAYLLAELKSRTKTEPEILKSQYQYGLVLIALSLIKSFENDEKIEEGSIPDEVNKISAALAPMILPMISALGELEKS